MCIESCAGKLVIFKKSIYMQFVPLFVFERDAKILMLPVMINGL